MAAFDFPSNPTPNLEVTNPNTGVTYKWDDVSSTWRVVGSTASDLFVTNTELAAETAARQAQDNILSERIVAIENDYTTTDEFNLLNNNIKAAQSTADSALSKAEANETAIENIPDATTYQIQTDKILRSSDPAIELVDSEGYYSNVKFQGSGGITVTSDMQSIIIDGSGIDNGSGDVTLTLLHQQNSVGIKVNGSLENGVEIPAANRYQAGVFTSTDWKKLDAFGSSSDYYTKAEIDAQFTLRGVGYKYLMSSFSGTPTIREGELHTDNRIAGQITMISLGPKDDNGRERRDAVVGDRIEFADELTGMHYEYLINQILPEAWGVEYVGKEQNALDPLGMGYPFVVYIYPTHISSADYYNKTQSNERFLNKKDGTQQTLASDVKYRGAQTSPEHIATVEFVNNAIASVQGISDAEIDQNEEQLQAISTSVFNLINKVDGLHELDLDSALAALAIAQQDIMDLKSKVNALEHTQFLILE